MAHRVITTCLTAIAVLMLGGVQPAGAITQEQAYQHLEQGNAYHKRGRYKEAVKEYKAAWEVGKLLDACFNLALTHDNDLNENQLAVKYYNEFLNTDALAPEAEEVRKLEDKARREVKQAAWWFDKQGRNRTKKQQAALLAAAQAHLKKDALALHKEREEDSYPGQAHVCLGCHAGFMGPQINMMSTHPVGRVPKGKLAETVPKHVRFYKEGQVICLSCHNEQNLHFEMGTPGINYKYLRVDTDRGEDMSRFCAFCHSSKSASRFLEGEEEEGRPRGGLGQRR